jgi:hypothetical protein
LSNPKTSFFQNQVAYFGFIISSGGPSIEDVQTLSVYATDKNGVAHCILYIRSSKAYLKVLNNITTWNVISSNGSIVIVEFQFTFNSQWFGIVDVDSSSPTTITTSATVSYAGSAKRDAQSDAATQDIAAQLPITIQLGTN